MIGFSQNEEDMPNGMNILALKPENDKKLSSYDVYKQNGGTGANSATDMFSVDKTILLTFS